MKWGPMPAVPFPHLYVFRRPDRLYDYPNSPVESAVAHQPLSIRALKTINRIASVCLMCAVNWLTASDQPSGSYPRATYSTLLQQRQTVFRKSNTRIKIDCSKHHENVRSFDIYRELHREKEKEERVT